MKKFIASFVSVLVVSATAIATVSSGAFNPNKDPNGDGILDIADATYIHQCLGGKYNPSDLTQLDMDDNGVVSAVDAMYAQMYDAGAIHSETPGDSTQGGIVSSAISTRYVAYNAKTGSQLRTYDLSVTNRDNTRNSTAEPNFVIGDTDDRMKDYSNRGTAKIMCSECDEGYRGSGFVIGKHKIATAAHVVFDTKIDRGWKLDNILLFDSNGVPTSVTPVEYHIPYVYKSSTSSYFERDYAIITVKEDLTKWMSFNLGEITDYADDYQLPVATVGFPKCLNDSSPDINTGTLHDERLSLGSIKKATSSVFYFNCDTSVGNSGGPIYTVEQVEGKVYYTVVGITVGENSFEMANTGVRIDASILKFFSDTTNILY